MALANLLPPAEAESDDLDSYMYQTVGHQLVGAYAACTGLPLFRRRIAGGSRQQGLVYEDTPGDEVEDLYCLLAAVQARLPGLQAVASGAIASDYQRTRVERVCARLGLVSLSYLWHQPQARLLRAMVRVACRRQAPLELLLMARERRPLLRSQVSLGTKETSPRLRRSRSRLMRSWSRSRRRG